MHTPGVDGHGRPLAWCGLLRRRWPIRLAQSTRMTSRVHRVDVARGGVPERLAPGRWRTEGEKRIAEPKKLRYRLLHVAARIPAPPDAPGCALPRAGPGPATWSRVHPADRATATDHLNTGPRPDEQSAEDSGHRAGPSARPWTPADLPEIVGPDRGFDQRLAKGCGRLDGRRASARPASHKGLVPQTFPLHLDAADVVDHSARGAFSRTAGWLLNTYTPHVPARLVPGKC